MKIFHQSLTFVLFQSALDGGDGQLLCKYYLFKVGHLLKP